MSDPISLTCLRNGEPARFAREVLDSIFLRYCTNKADYARKPDFMIVEYADGSRGELFLSNLSDEALALFASVKPPTTEIMNRVLDMPRGDPGFVQNVTFSHCGGNMFFDGLYELAHQTRSVISLYSGIAVTDEAVLDEVPEDFVGAKFPHVVHSGADIIRAIEAG